MKLSKKGFTMVELLAVIVIIGILAGVGVPAVSKYLKETRLKDYATMEQNSRTAAENYIIDNNIDVKGKEIIDINTELTETQYLETLVDPVDNSKECGGEVYIYRNKTEAGALPSYSYCVNVKCRTYETMYNSKDRNKSDITYEVIDDEGNKTVKTDKYNSAKGCKGIYYK